MSTEAAGTETTASTSSATETTSASTESGLTDSVVADLGVTAEQAQQILDSDPDYANMLKASAESGTTDTGDRSDNASGEESEENSCANGENQESGKSSVDENSNTTQQAAPEYADNVIDGLSGLEFGKLSEDAQTALANFYEKAQADSQKNTEIESRLQRLIDDPVIRSRITAVESGNAHKLQIRTVTEAEKQGLISGLQSEFGLDAEDSQAFISKLEAGIEKIAHNLAQDYANRAIVTQDNARRERETCAKGQETLLSLSQFNASLSVKETDLTKFYRVENGRGVYNEAHPEIETFRNGLGKIQEWAVKNGIGYDKLVQMGAKPFYAAAAAALDMPLAMNTGERDKKIAAEVTKKALSRFLKSTGNGTLNVQRAGVNSTPEKSPDMIIDGINALRLVQDAAYHESVLNMKFGDMAWMDKVDAIAAKGRAKLENRTKKSN